MVSVRCTKKSAKRVVVGEGQSHSREYGMVWPPSPDKKKKTRYAQESGLGVELGIVIRLVLALVVGLVLVLASEVGLG